MKHWHENTKLHYNTKNKSHDHAKETQDSQDDNFNNPAK